MPLAPLGQWYVHARSGAAQALLALGEERRARELAEAELADVRRFGGPDRNRADTGEAALASRPVLSLEWLSLISATCMSAVRASRRYDARSTKCSSDPWCRGTEAASSIRKSRTSFAVTRNAAKFEYKRQSCICCYCAGKAGSGPWPIMLNLALCSSLSEA